MKTCNCCKKELPGFMFGKVSRRKDGLNGTCKLCRSKKQKNRTVKSKSTNAVDNTKSEIQKKLHRKRLMEPYIKRLLIASGFDEETIKRYPQLIQIKRLQVKTLRAIKSKDNDNQG